MVQYAMCGGMPDTGFTQQLQDGYLLMNELREIFSFFALEILLVRIQFRILAHNRKLECVPYLHGHIGYSTQVFAPFCLGQGPDDGVCFAEQHAHALVNRHEFLGRKMIHILPDMRR